MDLDLWDCLGREKTCLMTKEIRYVASDQDQHCLLSGISI